MATDQRTYIRVHDGIEDHPKVAVLSDRAFRVLITTWGWSARHTTDGFIPDAMWRKRASAKVRAELEVQMVHRPGHDCRSCPAVPDGHVRMHDYLEHQRSADEVEQARVDRSGGGSLGNHRRWHVNAGKRSPDCEHCQKGTNPPSPKRSGNRSEERSVDRSLNDRPPIAEVYREKEPTYVGPPSHQSNAREIEPSGLAEHLLAEHLDACGGRGSSRGTDEVGRQIAAVVRDGVALDDIRAGLAAWRSDGNMPSSIPHFVDKAIRRRAVPTSSTRRIATSDRKLAEAELLKDNPDPAILALGGLSLADKPGGPHLRALPGGA